MIDQEEDDDQSGFMDFASDDAASDSDSDTDSISAEPWKVMIVDDEEEIHKVTLLALQGFVLHGRPLQFLHAYTGRDSVELMREHPDTAIVLMDVVMESEHAGLDAVKRIREELKNQFVRIVLRTGQPGQAPEREIVSTYDINDYKEKTELTAKKLFTLMHTGLGLHRELVAMDRSRKGLQRVIEASSSIFELKSFRQFATGVLQQLGALLYTRSNAVIVPAGLAAELDDDGKLNVLVGTGAYSEDQGGDPAAQMEPDAVELINRARESNEPVISNRHFAMHFATRKGQRYVLYLATESRIEDEGFELVQLFCQSVALALENLALHEEVVRSQQQMIMLLSSSIEERSRELKNHVRRVSEYATLLGRLAGLPESEIELLRVGAAMHDIGKIAVAESVLNKPGALSEVERTEMESHVHRGHELLKGQTGELLNHADIVISQHHEQWDGKGYPKGLKGEQIHLFGRIASIADVFDALTTTRCYKEPWAMEDVISYFGEQAGTQFDPELTRKFLDNIDQFLEIKADLSDAD